MEEQKESFSHFASIFPFSNMTESLEFYQGKLGFELTFTWNNPIDYAVLKRGGVSIHLTKREDDLKPSKVHRSLYIFVRNIDHVYDEFNSKGTNIKTSLATRDYGMTDFDIEDPDGYILTFGKNQE